MCLEQGERGCDKLSEHNTENSQCSADNMIHRRHVGEENQLEDGDVEKHYLKVRMSGLSKGHHQIKRKHCFIGCKDVQGVRRPQRMNESQRSNAVVTKK